MNYWQTSKPDAPATIRNESVARASDRVSVDRLTTYLASGRRLNIPGGTVGYYDEPGEEDCYLFGRVRIPPGTVAIKVHMHYSGAGCLVEFDAATSPTWVGAQQIQFPRVSGSPDPSNAGWVSTSPYGGITAPVPEGAYDLGGLLNGSLPAATWQDAHVRITIPTVLAIGEWRRISEPDFWWFECVMQDGVSI
jgi:hypothetical protein